MTVLNGYYSSSRVTLLYISYLGPNLSITTSAFAIKAKSIIASALTVNTKSVTVSALTIKVNSVEKSETFRAVKF